MGLKGYVDDAFKGIDQQCHLRCATEPKQYENQDDDLDRLV
jgi:hypothetical protein